MPAPTPTPDQFATPAPRTPTPTLTPARVELTVGWADHTHAQLTWAAAYGPVTLLRAPAGGAVVTLGAAFPKAGILETPALPYDIFIARILTGEQVSAQIGAALPPTLTARWQTSRSAVIAWSSSASLVCLYRYPKSGGGYFIGCWAQGSGRVELPGPPPSDFVNHPQSGDVYCIDADRARVCAPLISVSYLPVAWR